MAKITAQGAEITVMQIADQDYICITDKAKDDGLYKPTDFSRMYINDEYYFQAVS
jgi:hypothetical protein